MFIPESKLEPPHLIAFAFDITCRIKALASISLICLQSNLNILQ